METPPPQDCREMKIRLPARLATALHARKILTGEQIATTVERAVRAYYEAMDADTPRAGGLAEAARFPRLTQPSGMAVQGGDDE